MRKVLFGLMVLALLGLVACAKPPQQLIDSAKQAVDAAKAAEAATYAPDSLKAATDKAAALDAELAVQNDKFFKSYKLTEQLANELKTLADKAKADAVAGKEKAKADATAAITAAETSINDAREALKKAPKGKGSTADVAAMTGDVDAAAKGVEDAKADMTAEKFLDAQTKATNAKAAADKVKADVEAAIELKKSTKGHKK